MSNGHRGGLAGTGKCAGNGQVDGGQHIDLDVLFFKGEKAFLEKQHKREEVT